MPSPSYNDDGDDLIRTPKASEANAKRRNIRNPAITRLNTSCLPSQTQTAFMPIALPPTPAPSPASFTEGCHLDHLSITSFTHPLRPRTPAMPAQNATLRRQFLSFVLSSCTTSELLFISSVIAPLLKRDFIRYLPIEISLHIIEYIEDPKDLARAMQVSKHWSRLLKDELIWKTLCKRFRYDEWISQRKSRKKRRICEPVRENGCVQEDRHDDEPLVEMEEFAGIPSDPALEWIAAKRRAVYRDGRASTSPVSSSTTSVTTADIDDLANTPKNRKPRFSYFQHFKDSHITMTNWRRGGHLLRSHVRPIVTSDSGVVTSLALDSEWVVVGLANSKIHIFRSKTGVLARTLIGHELGVWGVCLVSRGGFKLPHKDADGGTNEAPLKPPSPPIRTTSYTTQLSENHSGAAKHPIDVLEEKNHTKRWSRWEKGGSRGLRSEFAGMGLQESDTYAPQSLDQYVPHPLRVALGLDSRRDSGDSDQSSESLPESEDSQAEENGSSPTAEERSNACFSSHGWGQPNSLVVSGGCDKVVRVWDIKSGYCIYVLSGHISTIRCIRVLHNRPIAITGSRDMTLRVWDVQRGLCLRVLAGHSSSVRCLDVYGNRAVSGSYDTTCRLWDIDTGECIHILRGHLHQIFAVAFDGERIVSGGLDTTVRVWDAQTGQCTALLQGHTALVCQLQLSPTILATGGSDGRVITFSLETYAALTRIAAHDSSITSLQFDRDFLVTGGGDGRVKLFDTKSGKFIRCLNDSSESVWKVAYVRDTCAIMCKRAGKTVMEIWTFRPREGQ